MPDLPAILASLFTSRRRRARPLIRRADAARDRRDFVAAAALYEEALRLVPRNGAVHVQAGHACKEAGDFTAAERHYAVAATLKPDDADLALQFGHLYKTMGRIAESERAYLRARTLAPDWEQPRLELDTLARMGWRSGPGEGDRAVQDALQHHDGLVPELVPAAETERAHPERIELRRLGRDERSVWGRIRTLRGIEAVRGFALSAEPIARIRVLLNGMALHEAPVRGPYPIEHEPAASPARKYVFNEWLDLTRFQPGRYRLDIVLVEQGGGTRCRSEEIRIAEPLDMARYPDADAIVTIDPGAPGSVEDRINAAPSIVRPALRTFFKAPPRSILIQRTDQLGDMVLSIPAMKRIRAIFPDARLVGLLTAANADLARTLGLFDEVLVVDFPDDPVQRRRIMPLAEQEQLRARLAPYRFDLAIDLAESAVSRPLLQLSGAPILFGFGEHDFPYLTGGHAGGTRDRANGGEAAGHSTKMLAMAERLGTLARPNGEIIRRPELGRERLVPYGIGVDERYMVLHAGARIAFSRWPHFAALARIILAETAHRVVMFGNGPEEERLLPAALRASDRFLFLARPLPFDDFDAFLSFADAFVGNDSGPKHLASLRGVAVVSVHAARVNWAEWGQEQSGLIVSRRVPCAGCALYYEAEECGKDFACIRNIRPAEVFDAVRSLLPAR